MRNRSTPTIPSDLLTLLVAAKALNSNTQSPRSVLSSPKTRGFTLTEIMVVVVIIVLMIGMALPAFRVITGSRSEEGARNLIASFLGRARGDAIGLDRPVGVAFLYNPGTQKSYLAEVNFPDCPEYVQNQSVVYGSCTKATSSSLSYYFVWTGTSGISKTPVTSMHTQSDVGANAWQWVGGPPLEMMPDTDLLPLPVGVGVQTVCNCSVNSSGVRISDGYLSTGVILFDGKGRLTAQPYGIPQASRLMAAVYGASLTSTTAFPFHDVNGPGPNGETGKSIGIYNYAGNITQYGVMSQYGLVVFQKDAFVGQNFPTSDPMYNVQTLEQRTGTGYTNTTPSQQTEETWLDVNATPLLIDRYTGTVIKAE